MSSLSIDKVGTSEQLAALEPEWRRLHAAHGEGLPFRTWDWYRAWWNAFPSASGWLEDQPRLLAFRTRAGELVGIAPLVLTRRPGRGPLAVRGLDFLGADPNVTEIRGPLLDPAFEEPYHVALRGYLTDTSREWDWFRWRGLVDGGAGVRLLQGTPGVTFTQPTTAYTLALQGTWESFKASRSRNLKESLRKCHNSLKRDGHEAILEVASSPAEVARGLDRFLGLHRARAEQRDGVIHPNVFASRAARHMLVDAFTRFAARGEARVFQLVIGGAVVAARLGFVLGDTLYFYYSGYDPAWGRYSVMTTTVAEAIRHAFAAGLAVAHLSVGTDISKTRWSPRERLYREATQVAPTGRARVVQALLGAYQTDRAPGAVRLVRRLVGRRRVAPRT